MYSLSQHCKLTLKLVDGTIWLDTVQNKTTNRKQITNYWHAFVIFHSDFSLLDLVKEYSAFYAGFGVEFRSYKTIDNLQHNA